jgi:hypothetical protein
LRRTLFERKYLKASLPPVSSLEDIESCLRQIAWTREGPLHLYDAISYPEAVWSRKKDDCDGFAILAAKLLLNLSAETNPVLVTTLVRPVQKSHTVCVFGQADKLRLFSNELLSNEIFETYNDVSRVISEGWRLVCWDVVNPRNLETLAFYVV